MSRKSLFNIEVIEGCLDIIRENSGNLMVAFEKCAKKFGGSSKTYRNNWYGVGHRKSSILREAAMEDPAFFTMINGDSVANKKNTYRKNID